MSEEITVYEGEESGIARPMGINPDNITGGMYCSMKSESREDRLAIFEAVTEAESLEDHINERLTIENIVIQPVEVTDSLTGEVKTQNRIVLVTADKRAFACVSIGVETSLKQLFGIVGLPPWKPAIDFKAVKENSSRGKYKFTALKLWKGEN